MHEGYTLTLLIDGKYILLYEASRCLTASSTEQLCMSVRMSDSASQHWRAESAECWSTKIAVGGRKRDDATEPNQQASCNDLASGAVGRLALGLRLELLKFPAGSE